MTIPMLLALVAALLNGLSGVSYIQATLRGEATPNRVTWLLWSLIPLLAGVAQIAGGVGWSTLVVFSGGLVPFAVFVASFFGPGAYWRLAKFDYLCGALSVLAVVLWQLSGEPLVAIVLGVVADALAALPTMRKAYLQPETEDGRTYVVSFAAMIVGLFSVTECTVVGYAFNLYLMSATGTLVWLVYRRRLLARFGLVVAGECVERSDTHRS
jgi:exosortase/archaeosortase